MRKKEEKEAIDNAIAERQIAEVARVNISRYFTAFSKYHREWMQVLVDKYKESGEFPVWPMVILPSYYTDRHDREIAVFASLLFYDNSKFETVNIFRRLMGEHPWQWFLDRGFVRLSLGDMQNKRTAGVHNWRIAKFFDAIYQAMQQASGYMGGLKIDFMLYDVFYGVLVWRMSNFADAVSYVVGDFLVGNVRRKIRDLLFVLGRSDGFSFGLWAIPQAEVKCPHTREILRFLRDWFPNYYRMGVTIGDIDYAIDLFKFKSAGDFYYSFLAWNWLCRKDPKGCKRYVTIYHKWYRDGDMKERNVWRKFQPELK